MTYTIIIHRKGHKDMIRSGVDRLNSIIIPAELKLTFNEEFKNNTMSVEIIPED